MVAKLAPNQQDKVRFLTGVPKSEREEQKGFKDEMAS